MKKLIVCADTHYSAVYPFSTDPNPFNDLFFRQSAQGVSQIIKAAKENDADVLHAGDWFDEGEINAPEAALTTIFLNNLEKNGIKLFVNFGNHDIAYKEGVPPVVQSFMSRCKIAYTARIDKKWVVFNWHGLNIYMLPYKEEGVFNSNFSEMLTAGIDRPACLCIHQDIKGLQVGSTVMKTGLTTDNICNLVKDYFKFIVCGHIHHPSFVERYGIPLLVPGSTLAVDFRDEGRLKGFYVLEFNDDFSIRSKRFEEFSEQIKFRTIGLDEIDEQFIHNAGKSFIRIQAKISASQRVSELSAALRTAGAIGIETKWLSETKSNDVQGYDRPVEMTMDDWLKKYMEKKHYDGDEIEAAIALNAALFSPNAR